ncbi:thioredoxin family protein [Gracilibacillus caseinilyticus]|uniref:Thioredoxin family protein n=1 Tax=Gracilibacillus caseinilyticus TaxID=2932256 RepID=A0ABY4ES01_9BACI|nr:thioredoxin family protein [Gracilibacillus caseinilyticus]UOQ46999.1 thioredoxin family protein [Gracilibacillus caseinilyticus]
MFETLKSEQDINLFLQEEDIFFLYISKNNCSVCHSLLPQIETIMERYPRIVTRQVIVDEIPSLASKFSIFTAPVLLLFVNGKEYLREARIVHLDQFQFKLDKVYQNY